MRHIQGASINFSSLSLFLMHKICNHGDVLMKDSYQIFFDDFGISSQQIINFGLKGAIFIPEESVGEERERLKTKIHSGNAMISIRGYGSGRRSARSIWN